MTRMLAPLRALTRPSNGPNYRAANRLASLWPSRASSTSVTQQLRRVAELSERVSGENSKSAKESIIAEYPDLRDLLEHVYDPNFRTHLSFASLQKYLSSGTSSTKIDASVGQSISQLLQALADREVTGNLAKERVVSFLRTNGIIDEEGHATAELEVFGRLLDRNLVAGFGARTLSAVRWDEGSAGQNPTSGSDLKTTHGRAPSASKAGYSPVTEPRPRDLRGFSVALGKSIEPPFRDIERSDVPWFASRKLDGVRVITLIDFHVAPSGDIELVNANFLSRNGKPFTSLGVVEARLHQLVKFPKLREWLDRDAQTVSNGPEGHIKRLVLDGEVCVMREKQGSTSALRADDGTGAGAIWADDHLEEDFTSTVGEIRRGWPYTIPHPVYFIFDIIDYTSFENKSGPTVFSQRIKDMNDLAEWLGTMAEKEKVLRPLTQWEVKGVEDVEGMVKRAAEEGWEGLVFRADKPYKGKRSSDIRKFKQWLDAEYMVVGTDNSRMRLAVNGVYGEYDAMANIWIEHKGVRVSVGSGFTAEQRIRFGQRPEDIIGKEVTVEYFSESASSSREGMSLRFPRVKQIWEDGRRTV